MATMTGYTPEKAYENVKPITMTIDALILEHIYSAMLDEILEDDGLMSIILSNGFYMAALCEAFEMATMTIKLKDGTTKTLHGPAPTQPMIYDLVMKQTNISTPGLDVLNHDFVDYDKHLKVEKAESNKIKQDISQGQY